MVIENPVLNTMYHIAGNIALDHSVASIVQAGKTNRNSQFPYSGRRNIFLYDSMYEFETKLKQK